MANTLKIDFKFRLFLTLIFTFIIWSHIGWDYHNGGVPVHYLFQSDEMPGISNFWGAILFPFFSFYLLSRIQKRIDESAIENLKKVGLRFLISLCCSGAISFFFLNNVDVIDYIMVAILLLAFIFPLYKSEYLLGWVVGSMFTFGAVIPMVFGSILTLLFFGFYQLKKLVVGLFRYKNV
ncbi:hypothetical protein [Maribacter sp. 2210JD10-5]|uniref:hypothetical protein n=1 Tax=Maribacter sp. 2210JD10-5 TaxID=3386272 RepID=UPI0039BD02C7